MHGESIQFVLVLILFQSILDYFRLFKFDVVKFTKTVIRLYF